MDSWEHKDHKDSSNIIRRHLCSSLSLRSLSEKMTGNTKKSQHWSYPCECVHPSDIFRQSPKFICFVWTLFPDSFLVMFPMLGNIRQEKLQRCARSHKVSSVPTSSRWIWAKTLIRSSTFLWISEQPSSEQPSSSSISDLKKENTAQL